MYWNAVSNRVEVDEMVKARKYVVTKRFEGLPKREDYEIVEVELPPIKNGEILVKVEWVSVDPYLRAYPAFLPNFKIPYDQFSKNVGLVLESKDPRYPVGSRVISHKGWCDYCILNTSNNSEAANENKIYKLPNLKGLSPSLGLGIVGMPGATAYFGLLELGEPKPGETVVITSAAGAVGYIVGLIAKLKGCQVVGFTSSAEKVDWLKKIGFDFAFNYKNVDVNVALKQAAPKGVDIYFDNVGGEMSSAIIYQMNQFGRVVVCGAITGYNESELPVATIIQPAVVSKQIKLQGIYIWSLFDRWSEAFAELIKWIHNGDLKVQEHVTEGFENLYDAFLGVLKGENTGKAVVKIAE